MTAILSFVLLLTVDDFTIGVRAYQEGRFGDALAAFTAAEKTAGDDASAALLYNKALAALRVGEFLQAETAAQQAAERGGPEFVARRDFLVGNIAFARCELADAATYGPRVTKATYDAAIGLAETARTHWQAAAMSRADWPEARRNVERALVKADILTKRRDESAKGGQPDRPRPQNRPQSRPVTPPQARPLPPERDPTMRADPLVKGDNVGDDRDARPLQVELSPEQVKRVIDKLGEKEREKRALRRAERPARQTGVERDW